MKKLKALFLVFFLLFLAIPSAAAGKTAEEVKAEKMIRQNMLTVDDSKVNDFQSQLKKEVSFPDTAVGDSTAQSTEDRINSLAQSTDFDLGEIYQFYLLDSHFITKYKQTGAADSIFTDKWFYHAKSNYAYVDFQLHSGKVVMKQAGQYGVKTMQIPAPDQLAKLVADQIQNVTSIKFGYCVSFPLYLVLIKTGSDEYAVAYNGMDHSDIGLESGKVYRVNNMMEILEKSPEKEILDGEVTAGPAVSAKPSGTPIPRIDLVVVAVIVAAMIAGIVLLLKKTKV